MLVKEEAKISRPVSVILMLDGVTVPVPDVKCEIGGVVEDVAIVNGNGLHFREGDLKASEGAKSTDQVCLMLLMF